MKNRYSLGFINEDYFRNFNFLFCCFMKAVECADQLMKKVVAQPQRAIDLIAAKCYFYLSRSYELDGCLANIRRFVLFLF